MSHPFGDLLSQYLHRKHGLSQSKLAAGILQDPAVIGKMCKGQRLNGPQARERVLSIIQWLQQQAVLATVDEANALLAAAGMAALRDSEAVEATLLSQLGTQHAVHRRARHAMTSASFLASEAEVAVALAQPWHEGVAQLNPGVSKLTRLSAGYSIPARPKHNLPAQTTPLLGREQELRQLADWLADPATRLITILSAGGMGKSHLAVAAALNQVAQFADGVCWVALAPLTEANALGFAIGVALGLQFEGGHPPEQQIGDFLQTKHLLLVLDNFEHLLAGAPLVGELLAKAPQLSILVTSRQRLKLSSETVMLLDGLSFPTDANADALDSPAVQLFLQHARRNQSHHQPDKQDMAGIVQICRLVDGMPLGILLAAAWTAVISPPEIAAEIGQDLGFLQSDLQDIPARQRNLRAVFLHTWSRLSADERIVFMRLSVFRGGATREAAQRVTGATIDVLAALTDKALLWRLPTGRYELHELLRQFAAEQLAAADASQGGRDRQAQLAHSRYYLTLLAEQEQLLQGQQQCAALDLIAADFENISVAWRWAVQQHEFILLVSAVHALFLYCEVRGSYREGLTLFSSAANALVFTNEMTEAEQAPFRPLIAQILGRLGACEAMLSNFGDAANTLQQGIRYVTSNQEKAFALAYWGHVALQRGDSSIGTQKLHESLALSRQADDLSGAARALHRRIWYFPDFTEAIQHCEKTLTLWRKVGRPDRIAEVLNLLALHICCQGDYAKALAYWQESMEICIPLGMRYNIAWSLDCQGWVAWCQGDLAAAQTYVEQALALYHEIGMSSNIAMCLADLAMILCSAGDRSKAVKVAREAVAMVRDTGDQPMLILGLTYLGATLIGAENLSAARQTLLEALHLVWPIQHTAFLLIALYYFAELLVLESQVADLPDPLARRTLALTLLSCVHSQPATWQIFKDKATLLQGKIEATLPAEQFSAAVQRGQSCTLQEMVNALIGNELDAS